PPGRQQPSARGPTSTTGSSVIVRPRANRVRQDANNPARGAPHRHPEAQSSSGPERTASARTPTPQREGPHIDNRKLSHRPAPSEPRPPGRQQPSARGPTSTTGSSVIVRPRAKGPQLSHRECIHICL